MMTGPITLYVFILVFLSLTLTLIKDLRSGRKRNHQYQSSQNVFNQSIWLELGICNKLHFVLFHARVGRFNPFCIRDVWPLLYLWSVGMAFISLWLHLVSSCSSFSSCPSVPRVRVRERSSSQSAIGSPE